MTMSFLLFLFTINSKVWILISRFCFCFCSSLRSVISDCKASTFWASATWMFSNWRERPVRHIMWTHDTKRTAPQCEENICHLCLVPFLSFLKILLGYFIIIAADFLDNLGQVGILGINFHNHFRLSDLLLQGIHILKEELYKLKQSLS